MLSAETDFPSNIVSRLLSSLFICMCLILLLLTSVPPVARDELVHHLAIPKLYLQHGGMYEIPELEFTYYPMNVDLLYLGALYLGNDILPKYIHFLFAIGVCLLVYHHLKKNYPQWLIPVGPLLFLSIPVVAKLSTTAYVDLGLTFFSFASILLCLNWLNRKNDRGFWTIFLAGCFAGLAAGTKYNGILTILILSLLLPLFTSRREGRSQFSQLTPVFFFFAGATLTFSPWLLRNFMWTGNPIYPLFQTVFNSAENPASLLTSPILERKLAFNESFLETLLLPFRVFVQGQDNNPQFFDGRLNPFLLFLPFACLIKGRHCLQMRRTNLFLALFSLLYILLALGHGLARVRYLAPALPCLVILCVSGLHNLQFFFNHRKLKTAGNVIVFCILLLALGLNGSYLHKLWRDVDPLPFISGTISREDYIARRWPEYRVVQYANQHLRRTDKTLAIFLGNRGYYLDIPYEFDLHLGKSQLISLINTASGDQEIVEELQSRGITHLLIWDELFSAEVSRLPPEKQQIFSSFQQNNVIELFRFQQHALYSLKD